MVSGCRKRRFREGNSEVLRQIPVAYFLVCMTLREPTEENRAKVLAYLTCLSIPEIKPIGNWRFAGAWITTTSPG